MAIVCHEPWNAMSQFHRQMDRLFAVYSRSDDADVVTSDWIPAVDIRDEDEAFVLEADIPGVAPVDIDVHTENGVLTIRGERRAESAVEPKHYKRVERMRGTFYRRFSLPDTADPERVSASSDNGVLVVKIPKHERTQPRKIRVKA